MGRLDGLVSLVRSSSISSVFGLREANLAVAQGICFAADGINYGSRFAFSVVFKG
jgi:hypothetical protein